MPASVYQLKYQPGIHTDLSICKLLYHGELVSIPFQRAFVTTRMVSLQEKVRILNVHQNPNCLFFSCTLLSNVNNTNREKCAQRTQIFLDVYIVTSGTILYIRKSEILLSRTITQIRIYFFNPNLDKKLGFVPNT